MYNNCIIKHVRKPLFHKKHTWSKRNTDSTFNVTMGSFDSAQTCELVGLFILSSLEDLRKTSDYTATMA